jgi:hypothetical protein
MFAMSYSSIGQITGSISIGPDITMPVCKPCTTLKATTTGASFGTNNYNISQINYTPYPFTGGTVVPLTVDDMWSGVINLPFDFCFYGNTYNQFIASSNGQIGFNIALANTFNPWSFNGIAPLPNATFTAAHNSIMAPYHDILPTQLGIMSYQTFGTAPNRVFVFTWNNSPMFSCTSLLATQQIALYETSHIIETYIANKPLCSTWNQGQAIHGLQNINGTVAHIVPGRNLPTQWTATNDAWRFSPSGGAGGGGGQASVFIEWFDENNNLLASNVDSLDICPTKTTTYRAKGNIYICGAFDIKEDTITVTVLPSLSLLSLISLM